ncbi:hypothetical protein MICA_852 [Micavibrio aeruginosavorus ARL-13]|uniref:Uncharacterized protein n=1 Tax=Micavibrio aeruginosavorus (strain ARL-13) TaxID=856793 RepID=G2KRD8_MICAA|nr:hypothetical protein MICA_852 [Micavibrio aeruginosavorus ARL-13]
MAVIHGSLFSTLPPNFKPSPRKSRQGLSGVCAIEGPSRQKSRIKAGAFSGMTALFYILFLNCSYLPL